jgi:hypothetical protein
MLHRSGMLCACEQFGLCVKEAEQLKLAAKATLPCGLRTFLMGAIFKYRAPLQKGLLMLDMSAYALLSPAHRRNRIMLQLSVALNPVLHLAQAVKLGLLMEYGTASGMTKMVIPPGYMQAATQELLATSHSNKASTAPGVVQAGPGPAAGRNGHDVLRALLHRDGDEAAAEQQLWLQAGKKRPACSDIFPTKVVPPEDNEQQGQQDIPDAEQPDVDQI